MILLAVVPVLQTRDAPTGKIPTGTDEKVTTRPLIVVTRTFPVVPTYNALALVLKFSESLGVTATASIAG